MATKDLLESTKESLERMQRFDVRQLARADELGRSLSFEEAIPFAKKLTELYQRLGTSVIEDLALRVCPSCGQQIRWFRPGILVCECGHDLSETEQPEASPGLVVLMEILRHKVLDVPLRTTPGGGLLPNKRAIAAACGFSREAFYDNPRVASLLAEHMRQFAKACP